MFNRAIKAACKQDGRAFFPTPGEVNAYIAPLKKKVFPPALEVWQRLEGAVGRNGSGVHVVFRDNPAALEAIRHIPYGSINVADYEYEYPQMQRTFTKAYEQAVKKYELVSQMTPQVTPIGHDDAKKLLGDISSKLAVSLKTKEIA